MEDWVAEVLKLLAAALVGGGTAGAGFLIRWRREGARERQSDNEWMADRYRKLDEMRLRDNAELKKAYSEIRSDMVKIQEEHIQCRAENTDLKRRLSLQDEKIAYLEERVGRMQSLSEGD